MANTVFKLRRSSVAGKVPNTATLAIGELGINLTDRKLYSSDGTNVWETGANLTTLAVSTNTNVNNVIFSGAIYANSSTGSSGQVLASNGTGIYWTSSSGGGGGTLPVFQQFTGDGITTSFAVSGGYPASNISVFLNGVLLRNGTDVTVSSGTNVVFAVAPPNGSLIDVVGVSNIYSTGVNAVVSQQFTANGSANSFAVTGGYVANQVQVFLNGVKQIPGTDVDLTSGANVGFYSAPSNGFIVDVYGYQTMVVANTNVLSVGANVVINTAGITVGNSSVNTQIIAGNVFLNGSTLVVGNTATNVTINSTAISVSGQSINSTNYQTTAGLSANVATLTANNTSFVGSIAAANVVSNAQLQANLGNYVTTTNLTNNLANYQTTAGLTANIAVYLPTYTGVVNGATFSVGTTFTVNSTIININSVGVYANGSLGTANQVLTSNGTKTYWSTPSAGVTTGKAIAMAIVFGG